MTSICSLSLNIVSSNGAVGNAADAEEEPSMLQTFLPLCSKCFCLILPSSFSRIGRGL